MADGGHQQFGALHSAYQVNHIYIKARLKRSLSDPCFLSRNCLCPIKEEKPPKNMYHTPSPPPPFVLFLREARRSKSALSLGYHGNIVDLW